MNWEPISLSTYGTLSPLTIRGGEIMSETLPVYVKFINYPLMTSMILSYASSLLAIVYLIFWR